MTTTNTTTTSVITYQLAYISTLTVNLCAACADRGDHQLGALGPVSYGLHAGHCQSLTHVAAPVVEVEQAPAETRLAKEDRILAKHHCVVEPGANGRRVIGVLARYSRGWPLDGDVIAACRAELESAGISTSGWLQP